MDSKRFYRILLLQGDRRSYSYVVGLSTEETNSEVTDWEDLLFLAKLIPRVCHNVNRVCYIFGCQLHHPVTDITPTHLTSNVIATLRQADHVANQVLVANGYMGAISQMPVVLIPIHFDRDAASRIPSCQRSIVLRPFCTNDFMTGTPAIPIKELPLHVSSMDFKLIVKLPLWDLRNTHKLRFYRW